MGRSTVTAGSNILLTESSSSEQDFQAAKADLAARFHRLLKHRRLVTADAANILGVGESRVLALFQGRLATCSFDQLLRNARVVG
jgi:hypothetical protein